MICASGGYTCARGLSSIRPRSERQCRGVARPRLCGLRAYDFQRRIDRRQAEQRDQAGIAEHDDASDPGRRHVEHRGPIAAMCGEPEPRARSGLGFMAQAQIRRGTGRGSVSSYRRGSIRGHRGAGSRRGEPLPAATRYDAIHRNIYVPSGHQLTPVQKAIAAWLWSRRQATVAGVSAVALHGSLWIDARLPAELNQPSQQMTKGIVLR